MANSASSSSQSIRSLNTSTTTIKMGPFPWVISGKDAGVHFDHSGYDGIKSIVIKSGSGIDSIKVQYLRGDEQVLAVKVGGHGGDDNPTIVLDHPHEYLIAIKGHHGKFEGQPILKSLTLISNLNTYGPFGDGQGVPFKAKASKLGQGAKIVGFHGKARPYISQLGVYVLPLPTTSFFVPVQNKMDSLETGVRDSENKILAILQPMKNLIANIEKDLQKIKEQTLAVASNVHHHEGPLGGNDGVAWDDGCFPGIKCIIVSTNMENALSSMEPIYDMNGWPHPSLRRGHLSISVYRIEFKYPEERLERISGFIDPWKEDPAVVAVKSLTFHTNKGKYGPFGEEIGEAFSSSEYKGEIIGFFGRSTGAYINAIGVHIKCFNA